MSGADARGEDFRLARNFAADENAAIVPRARRERHASC